MPKSKVKDGDLRKLAGIYNAEGRTAVYELLRNQYEVKNLYFVMRRMLKKTELSYHAKEDHFDIQNRINPESVFMGMDELCTPGGLVPSARTFGTTLTEIPGKILHFPPL